MAVKFRKAQDNFVGAGWDGGRAWWVDLGSPGAIGLESRRCTRVGVVEVGSNLLQLASVTACAGLRRLAPFNFLPDSGGLNTRGNAQCKKQGQDFRWRISDYRFSGAVL